MNKYRQLEMKEITHMRKEEYKYFVGTTLKNPLQYAPGEKMIFKIRVKYMDGYLDIPFVWYSLTSDDGQKTEGYIRKGDDGWFYIEASISKSGFVYVQAKACDENKRLIEGIATYNGSAGADVNGILRATKIPDGYLEFWDGLKAEVEACEPEVLYCEEIKNDSDFEMYDMRIKAPRSDYVSVAIAYPKGAKKNSLKLAMSFQGYGVNPAGAVPLKNHFSVSVNAHSIPNGKDAEFYADIRDNKLKGYGYDAEENKNPQSTYWVKMMLRDLQAIRFFKDHELLDKKNYCFIGSSQGGMQACNVAAHFDRATAVVLNVPWLSDIYGHELCGRRENNMPKGLGVTYFDTAVAARFLKCSAYIISGLGDVTCNASTQMALFNSIKSPKYIEFYQNKVHSFTIPWDKNMYALGEPSLADEFEEYTEQYHAFD
ncbi:MAG: acetylxylan esterase [Ruminococcaceae bacterium]|nr:acetylxylan esterase [Oscillospiraceae bacterium]